MKRLLNCTTSEALAMNGEELKQSILACEGRTVMTETVVAIPPLLGDLTNAELAVSFGSDMVLLNVFDCNNPVINGIEGTDEPVKELKRLVGRPVGCNLEPVDPDAKMMETRHVIAAGRQATKETIQKVQQLLTNLGYDSGSTDGIPGKLTNSAILQFEKDHGLEENTDITPALIQALEQAVGEQ